ncbi:MAG TPA: amino acid permease [Bacteroidota bacterium]|nr:amino acid permease [Bacteroidota bacterium]
MNDPARNGGPDGGLIRGIGLGSAVGLNMIDMIGVGPFITIPLIVSAMGGPQALAGWIAGALLAMCDGLVWAELAAAIPGTGGSYRYLREIYNPETAGRLFAFLFLWQLSFSAPLSIASGCVGLAQYASYLWPALAPPLFRIPLGIPLQLLGGLQGTLEISGATFIAMSACAAAVFLLYRRITVVTRVTNFLWIGVCLTILWIIATGVAHFDRHLAFSFPDGAFSLSSGFLTGLGAGMLVAVYDYWGYYNICFLAGEVRRPERTIPRAILISIALVSVLYLTMNLSILGSLPWQQIIASTHSESYRYLIAVFMERFYGGTGASIATVLIMWTAFASVCSLLLGYSRIPYAAAREGDYFRLFSAVHPKDQFPTVSLLMLGGVAVLFCFFRLADLIAALVVIRIVIQFITQTIGLVVYRFRRPAAERPFRVWLYPLPVLLTLAGFSYILFMRKNFLQEFRYAVVLIIAGSVIFLIRSKRTGLWPFRPSGAPSGK